MTTEELIDKILLRLDEIDASDPVYWTRPEILVFVNDAIYELNLIALEIQGTGTRSLNSSDNVYDTPAGMIGITGIRVGTEYLREENLDNLDREAQWEDSGQSRLKVRVYSRLGLNKFIVWPRPLAAATATVEGLLSHTVVTDGSGALPVRPEYELALEEYCVERATFKEGGYELNHAGAFYQRFLDIAQEQSGRNISRAYPRYPSGDVGESTLRNDAEAGKK